MKTKPLYQPLRAAIVAGLVICFSACEKQNAPKPYGPTPTPAQLEWQKMEYYMFAHFGPNTFTDVEWGDGKEDPKVFAPTHLDCQQWAKTARLAGMKGIIITAKHHDGFCLWPSAYSTHTVRESGWKNGNGDVLKELSRACKKEGIKFGVYISPWDQNHPSYGTPEYNNIFAATVSEVHSKYGPIFEQWFDGACSEEAKGFKYDWPLFNSTVFSLSPNAIIFSDTGPGCRWVGNESGVAGQTNWSLLYTEGFVPGSGAPRSEILNSGNQSGNQWIPAEADVSIRPGWFYSPSTDSQVKSVDNLMDIYFSSVGRNANLILNVPPDRSGRINPIDSTRLMEFKDAREKAFQDDFAKRSNCVSSDVRGGKARFAAANIVDGKYKSYWTTDDGVTSSSFTVSFRIPRKISMVLLQEYIALGQRVEEFSIECRPSEDEPWKEIGHGTTIGYKRIVRFPEVEAAAVRVNIIKSLACPLINNAEIY